ncbi:lantibiotic dehydratase [Streptomyces yokosukanensis]|uniref:lantibiotic dehydratase n=1 Tax=Streptomyces yokosukanensis TaxID=67386 RepID=UPI0034325ADC
MTARDSTTTDSTATDSAATDGSATEAAAPISVGGWELWPSAMVRSAGFPAASVARLADPFLADLADRAADQPGAATAEGYARAWEQSGEHRSREIGAVARSDAFRLAVTWQNPRFWDNAVEPLLRQLATGRPGNTKQRTREQAVAAYWQRYCLKNESIGFFGPTAFAAIDPRRPGVTVRSGPRLVDDAVVHLERWPVEALARRLETAFDLGPWLCPRRSPLVRLDGDTVVLADGTAPAVDPLDALLLRLADGTATARQLARRLRSHSRGAALDEPAVYERLALLRRRRMLVWRLELPTSPTSEEELLAALERIEDPAVREAAQAPVRALVDARADLQQVWDQPDRLRAELDRLEATHTVLTGAPATRNDGLAYGGRTLAYLECRRDVTVGLGASFVDALRPLTLVLDSVRWLTWHIGEQLRPRLDAAYHRVQSRTAGTDEVDAAAFWTTCMTMFGAELRTVVDEALAEFHRRWRKVLPVPETARRVDVARTDVAAAVRELFDAPAAGWTQARTVCPDVMLAAPSARDVEAGRFTLVLGEVHAAMNSMDYLTMVPRHHDPSELTRALDATFPAPRLLPLLPPESRPHFTVRSHPALIRPTDRRIALAPQTPLPRHGHVLLGADARIRERDGSLWVVAPDGAEFAAVDLFGEVLKSLLLRTFDLFPVERHRPRITLDQVVISREGWRIPVRELDFAQLPDPAARFAAARAWARRHGLPRQVFVKAPGETKPVHVDFAAPVLVELLASSVRRVLRAAAPDAEPALKFVEMLPDTQQTWLPDAEGRTYTSEFRLAFCDPTGTAGLRFPSVLPSQ